MKRIHSGNRRKPAQYTARDVAKAAGVGYRTALDDEKNGKWTYGDLLSVSNYVSNRIKK